MNERKGKIIPITKEKNLDLEELAEILEGKNWNVSNWDDAAIHFHFQSAEVTYDLENDELLIRSGIWSNDDAVEVRTRVTNVYTDQSLIEDITFYGDSGEIMINFTNDDFWNLTQARTFEEEQKQLKEWKEKQGIQR